MAAVLVIRPGLQTTVQDLGRWGYQASGVPVAGAMDVRAHRIANALVGNPASAATLEITLTGPELRFEDARAIAVSGAAFELRVESEGVGSSGATYSSEAAILVPAGATLTFRSRSKGARAYLAVSGGFDVPLVFGSRSTHVPAAMGGFDGRILRPGDRVPLGPNVSPDRSPGPTVPPERRAWPASPVTLRVLPGPDVDAFKGRALDILQSAPFVLQDDSNRMGYRLNGPAILQPRSAEKLSEAMPIGAIQVPPSGDPVLLMADRPTTGGYPVVANVITPDIDRAAQLAPGDALRFAVCAFSEAQECMLERERELAQLERGCR
jgi:biotin-dependent carboxylase-like uncharacterized protein